MMSPMIIDHIGRICNFSLVIMQKFKNIPLLRYAEFKQSLIWCNGIVHYSKSSINRVLSYHLWSPENNPSSSKNCKAGNCFPECISSLNETVILY